MPNEVAQVHEQSSTDYSERSILEKLAEANSTEYSVEN